MKSFINFSYSTVPLGLAAWITFSFGILLPNGGYILHIPSHPFSWGWDLFGSAHYPWTPVATAVMPYLQIASLLVGLLCRSIPRFSWGGRATGGARPPCALRCP